MKSVVGSLFQKPEASFGFLALVFGLLMVFLNPPLLAPDEAGHFARAYQFATQGWRAVESVSFDVQMPASVADSFSMWAARIEAPAGQMRPPYTFTAIKEDAGKPFDGAGPRSVPLARPQAIMCPLAYFPAALAMAVGTHVKASFLTLLYSARLVSFLFCLVLTVVALRLMPFGPLGLVAVNLLPMAVYERAQLTSDGLVLAAASLCLAVLLRLYVDEKKGNTEGRRGLYALLVLGLLLLAVGKAIYLAVFLLWALLLKRAWAPWVRGALLVLPAVAVSVWWGHFLSLHDYAIPGDRAGLLDPRGKMDLLIHAPADVLMRMLRTLLRHVFDWAGQMVGVFGVMDIKLPLPARFLGFFWLVGVACVATPVRAFLSKRQGWGLIGVFGVQVFLVLLTLFLIWADPAARYVGGVQGRYFLPLLPCLLVGVAAVLPRRLGRVWSERARFQYVWGGASVLLLCATFYLTAQTWG